jgi:ubiquinone/menaquinone biosynthesis C-methylase UbiE
MTFNEGKYYFFGIRVGLSNLFHHGFTLGVKKTFGKILQPVNAFSRFPEYYYFHSRIHTFIDQHRSTMLKILDVGSPKLFGLFLASKYPVTITLTDYHEENLAEYRYLWKSMKRTVNGQVEFTATDARSLSFDDETFDIVYAMSVLEHVEGHHGDSKALKDLLRVLKKGGLLVISVPFGSNYIEQCIEVSQAYLTDALRTADGNAFFQRIYNLECLQSRVLRYVSGYHELKLVSRRWPSLLRLYMRNPLWLRAMLGWFNPILSFLFNVDNENFHTPPSNYHIQHKVFDVYSDLILFYVKDGEVIETEG